ncbi:hypothetical protein CEXT_601401 [Caerostris extrusa]|uniref:Uncharacterized protein n=1 Tax=Caerostris extrusa TaxID=172846 RepID=A0AAV4QDQ9_CAEEX|nr:hypothetical protein CEXT_601401 [Caerostris extrusa]
MSFGRLHIFARAEEFDMIFQKYSSQCAPNRWNGMTPEGEDRPANVLLEITFPLIRASSSLLSFAASLLLQGASPPIIIKGFRNRSEKCDRLSLSL